MSDYALYDEETKKWFKNHPYVITTVEFCEICNLFYNPSLGHKCKKRKENKND